MSSDAGHMSATESGTMFTEPECDDDGLDDDACSSCGADLDDGEGYDGLCGDCADVAESTCSVCSGRFIDDPDGSPGVVVHDPEGLPGPGSGWDYMTSHDLDSDHVPLNEWD